MRNMRQLKFLFFSIFTLLFALACMLVDFSRPTPTTTPTETPLETPTFILLPTQTATPSPVHPLSLSEPIPPWIKDFSDPIFEAVANHPPAFEDDFSGYNLGWLYFNYGSQAGPFYAPIQDESLTLKIPGKNNRRDSMVYNSNLIRRDFVLSLDFKFGKTQPDDTLRFQFNQSADQSVILDLSKHEDWSFDWSFHNSLQSHAGRYYYFSPEYINVLIVMKGSECAVFLNHDPLDYLSDCRSGSMVQPSSLAVSFHLLSITGYDAFITIDNVKLWDLEKIPDLH